MERPDTTDCKFCSSLTSDQCAQLSTPSYKIKNEKMDLSSTLSKDTFNPSLMDPASVSAIGAVDGQGMLQSPGFSGSEEKKAKKVEKEKATSSEVKSCSDKPAKPVSDSRRSAKASTDARFAELNQKWSDRFNRLEALLLARTMDKEPTFQTVIVAPTTGRCSEIYRAFYQTNNQQLGLQ